jgi:hypothetical protein
MADFGKLAFGVRVADRVDASFFWCWSHLLTSGKIRKGDKVLRPAVGLPHGPACCILLQWFLRTDCDALLFVDDDMEFTPEAIERLRSDDHGFDVVSSLCVTRRAPHAPIVLSTFNAELGRPVRFSGADIAAKGVIEVGYVGFGGVIVKRWVLERLAKDRPDEPVFRFDPKRGEDGQFSDDARAVGARLAVNTDVRFGHRATVALYWNKEAQAVDFAENDYGMGIMQLDTKGA